MSISLSSLATQYLNDKNAFNNLEAIKDAKLTQTKQQIRALRKHLTETDPIAIQYKKTKDTFKKTVISQFKLGDPVEKIQKEIHIADKSIEKKIEKWFGKFLKKVQK